jgi:hypothetical protein
VIRFILFALIGLVGGQAFAFPCDCGSQKQTAKDLERGAPVVFWGEVVEFSKLHDAQVVHLRVDQVRKGTRQGQVFRVLSDPNCPTSFELGESYVVLASQHLPNFGDRRLRGRWTTNRCAGTRRAPYPPRIAELLDVPPATDHDDKVSSALDKVVQGCPNEGEQITIERFQVALAKDDDPLIIEPPSARRPQKEPPSCVATALIGNRRIRDIREDVLVRGTARLTDDRLSSTAEVRACGDLTPCASFSDIVHTDLNQVVLPRTAEQARLVASGLKTEDDRDTSVEIARTLCTVDGWEAARDFARNNRVMGGKLWQRAFERMLFDCAVSLGKFELALENIGGAPPGSIYEVGLSWAQERSAADDWKPPFRKDGPTFVSKWSEATGHTEGAATMIRQQFVRSTGWTNDLIWLEAFAEAVAADEHAPPAVRRVGALAYHKAARLYPPAAEQYEQWADDLIAPKEMSADLAELDAAFEEAAFFRDDLAKQASRKLARDVERAEPLELDEARPLDLAKRRPAAKPERPKKKVNWREHVMSVLGVLCFLLVAGAIWRKGTR